MYFLFSILSLSTTVPTHKTSSASRRCPRGFVEILRWGLFLVFFGGGVVVVVLVDVWFVLVFVVIVFGVLFSFMWQLS